MFNAKINIKMKTAKHNPAIKYLSKYCMYSFYRKALYIFIFKLAVVSS